MRKESFVLIFGTVLSTVALIAFKEVHFYLHGLCSCLSGKLFEYAIPVSGFVLVILLTNKTILKLIKQRESESEKLQKVYETMDGISRISGVMLSDFKLNKLDRTGSYLRIIGIILGTEKVKLKNKAAACFLAFINKQNNALEGNVIYKKGEELVVNDELIRIDMGSRVAVTRGVKDVEFSNWSGIGGSIEEYQKKFDYMIRQKVGTVKNFITYRFIGFEEGALIFFNYENDVDQYDAEIVRDLVVHFSSLYSISVKQRENQILQYTVMRKLADLAETRDLETGSHLFRIQGYCRFIAEKLSVKERFRRLIDYVFIENIYYSSPLHDIGKVGIPDRILLKPGKITLDEMAVMKTHTLIGAEILKGPDFLKMGKDIAHYHHEKWDGSGYPDGIKGESIPLSARIMALADVYDALVSKRVYKEAFTQETAVSIIKEGIGSHFDPDVGDVFMEHSGKFTEIGKNFSE